jgi:nucleoid-associated protein YgaU
VEGIREAQGRPAASLASAKSADHSDRQKQRGEGARRRLLRLRLGAARRPQDKLATALRSFTVVQDENTQLKASLDKANSDNASLTQQLDSARASIASLQVQAAATSQIEPLRPSSGSPRTRRAASPPRTRSSGPASSLQSPGPGLHQARPHPPRAGPAWRRPRPARPPRRLPRAKTYVVVEGDTLTKISKKFYGTSSRWEDILNANHAVLKDEKSLVVGSTLTIP